MPTTPRRHTSPHRPALKVVSKQNASTGQPSPTGFLVLLLLLAVAFAGYHLFADGPESLAPERQAKLARELDEIDNAVQYALLATLDGHYPCYTCPMGLKTIFLSRGEVWRYGTTGRGEARRYPGADYGAPNLTYVVQFEGPLNECVKLEKQKIYHYPLLPEARRRAVRLARPPGNKLDR